MFSCSRILYLIATLLRNTGLELKQFTVKHYCNTVNIAIEVCLQVVKAALAEVCKILRMSQCKAEVLALALFYVI